MSMPPDLMEYLLRMNGLPQNMDTAFGQVNSQVPRQPPQPESFGQKLQGLLGSGFDDPRTQGLLGMGAAMLQASGPSTMPISTGQALGMGIQAYNQGRIGKQGFDTNQRLKEAQTHRLMNPAVGHGPASIQEWLYYQSLSPEQKEEFKKLKRAEQWLNLGGTYQNPATGGTLTKTIPPEQLPSTKGAQAAAEVSGRKGVEKELDRPKVEAGISAAAAKMGFLDETIDTAKGQADKWFTTGVTGKFLSGFPGTEAHDLSKNLDTIKANIGFDKLQEMRANSPTGGALGQVSERENTLLQAVWGSLEQSQSADQFKKNLENVRKQTKESWGRILEAYKKDYGKDYDGPMPWGGSSSAETWNEGGYMYRRLPDGTVQRKKK